MTTKRFSSMRVATESVFASVDPATGIPSAAGLSWSTAELMDMTQVVTFGDAAMEDNNGTRRGFHDLPMRPNTVKSLAGVPIQRRSGTITVDMPIVPVGDRSTFATYDAHPLGMLLSTILQHFTPADTTITAVSSGGSAGVFTTAPLTPVYGEVLGVLRNDSGRSEYVAKYDGAGAICNVRPDLSTVASTDDTVHPMEQWLIPASGQPTTTTVALELIGDGWTSYAYGCKVESLTITPQDGSRRAVATMAIRCAFISIDLTAGSPVVPAYADGTDLHQLQAPVTVSQAGIVVGASAIGTVADYAVCTDSLSLSVTATLEPTGCGGSVVGHSGWEQVGLETRLTMTLAGVDNSWSTMMWAEQMPMVMVGFGGGPLTDEGEGGCIFIPAATIMTDPKVLDTGAERNRTMLTFGAGPYTDDTGTTTPADSSLRVCLGAGTTP